MPSFDRMDLTAGQADFLPLLRTLTEIPAPTGQEERRGDFCRRWLAEAGCTGVYTDSAGNVIYPHRCSGRDDAIVVMAHLDTVFPDRAITVREEGDRLYAPGIGDDTANLAALLLAARYVARHNCAVPVWFVADVGEEGEGNLRGCRQFFADHPHVREFLGLDGQFGHYTVCPIGSRRYRVTVRTPGGHSFHDFGTPNAIERLSGLVQELYRYPVPTRARTTCNVGKITGGTSVNSIAQEAEMLWEFRSEAMDCLEEMETAFRSAVDRCRAPGVTVEVESIGVRPCMGTVDPERQEALWQRCREALGHHFDGPLTPESGSTDANIPWSLGIPSCTVGCVDTGGAHTREEWINARQAPDGLAFLLRLVLSYCED